MRNCILVAPVMALAAVLALGSGASAADRCYFTLQASEKCSIYAEIEGTDLRLSSTAGDFTKALVVKGKAPAQGRAVQWSETALSIPADGLPAKCTGVKLVLAAYTPSNSRAGQQGPYLYGTLNLSAADEQNAVWSYAVRFGQPSGASAAKAPVIQIPALDKVTLEVATQAVKRSDSNLGIGLRCKLAGKEITDIRKGGTPVNAEVKLVGAGDKVITSAVKPLGQFGFS